MGAAPRSKEQHERDMRARLGNPTGGALGQQPATPPASAPDTGTPFAPGVTPQTPVGWNAAPAGSGAAGLGRTGQGTLPTPDATDALLRQGVGLRLRLGRGRRASFVAGQGLTAGLPPGGKR